MAIHRETELYMPVKAYFEKKGYRVRSEVKNCDLVAMREGEAELIIVELKKTFNLQLVFQAIERLKLSDSVYAAVEYHPRKKISSYFSWRDAAGLCSMLGIGLIGVQFYKTKTPAVDILCRPGASISIGKSKSGEKRIKSEFERRSGDFNTGGSSKRKLVTAYREKALRCAAIISKHNSMTPANLRELLSDPTTTRMLQDNYYGWFDRIKRGHYQLSDAGRQALIDYAELISTSALCIHTAANIPSAMATDTISECTPISPAAHKC